MLSNRIGTVANRLTPRPKTAAPVYGSPEWRSLIAGIIRERGRRCEDPRCTTPNRAAGQKVYGDHIHELQDGGALLDPNNVLLRCAPCHGKKTATERNKRLAARWWQ
jgi:5-methylcytosine-specific restriction protein A